MSAGGAKSSDSRYHRLDNTQLSALRGLLKSQVVVQSKYAYPTLQFPLLDFIFALRDRFVSQQIQFDSFKLNGGAASYVLDQGKSSNSSSDGGSDDRPADGQHPAEDAQPPEEQQPDYADFNDIDIIITMNLDDWDAVRSCAFAALHEFIPYGKGEKLPLTSMWDAYVGKLVHVNNENDKWALISFTNYSSRNLELKFVQTMRRQYQFTVDSFHISLDAFLSAEGSNEPAEDGSTVVLAESVYGNFPEAFRHLRHRLIATRQPEEIRGGGLLRYCHLLVKGFQPENYQEMRNLERYMCTRFFIDFNDPERQQHRLRSYINTHLRSSSLVTEWLRCLHAVVGSNSSLCLMNQERQRTLQLISHIALLYIHSQYQYLQQQQQPTLINQTSYTPNQNNNHSDSSNDKPVVAAAVPQQQKLVVDRGQQHGGRRQPPFRRRPRFGPFFFQGGPPFILYSTTTTTSAAGATNS